MHRLLQKGGRMLLLGNEAIVRGALESGVGFVASYPGTPSSEIGDTFSDVAKEAGIYFEWSVNEKVATEAAAGAAFSGVRSMTFFKHFGFNVASDSVYPLPYYGVEKGMVLLVADDPNGWSSGQSEEDTRRMIMTSHMPYLEPSNPQECKDFVKLAFDMSSRFKIPIFLRTTTRVNHVRAPVKLGKIVKGEATGVFLKGRQWNTMPPKVIDMHSNLHAKLQELEKFSEDSQVHLILNKKSKSDFGIVTSGASFNYVTEALLKLGLDRQIPVFRVGMWPCPKGRLAEFMRDKRQVLVVEELDPILENEVKRIAQESGLHLPVHGKDLLPSFGELRIEKIIRVLDALLDLKVETKKIFQIPVPDRDPTLCPGCPHRASFWAVKSIVGKDCVFGGDIGCYILGIFEPIEMQDFIISMAAGTGISHGISKVSSQNIVVFIGDSTFFHAGIPAVINAVYNKSNLTIVVLDNRITAMTGHQPHPGAGFTGMKEQSSEISIADIAKACGAQVVTVNPFNLRQMSKAVRDMSQRKGVKVIIARQECRLMFMRNARRKGISVPVFQIDKEKCKKCGICIQYGCPAIHLDIKDKSKKSTRYYIDENFCWGCGVCSQICPFQAINAVSRQTTEKPKEKK
ncbi:MAG: indolepyruvate ferredoxin oxidoreductase subunit alpha [Candidatus Micrarchaeia archaeon]